MLLIVSKKLDTHVDFLMERMTELQRRHTVVYQTESFPMNSTVSLTLSESSSLFIGDNRVDLNRIKSAWFRRPEKPTIDPKITNESLREYAETESQDCLLGLWEGMNEWYWVSKPSSIRGASYKWEQLLRAKKMGFRTPETLFTNNPAQAREFCGRISKAVVKAASHGGFLWNGVYKMAYTTPVNTNDPHIDDVQLAPCMFQEYIQKDVELRITVISDEVFPCAIYSQNTETTRDDWRHYDFQNTPHKPWTLPPEIQEKCIQYVASYGLNFGAIDMIVTPDGEYVFLEINPNGQWAWIEVLTELPISRALLNRFFYFLR